MAKLHNISTEWRTTIFILLLSQNIVLIKPEDVVDLHFRENVWSDGALEQNLRKIQYIQKVTSTLTLKKPRFLCLHGHGSNAAQFEKYFDVWPKFITDKIDLIFINGPFPIDNDGTSVNEHFVWLGFNKVTMEYDKFEEGIAYIEDHMIELGPFDGVLGFSEGAFITGALPGMQEQGLCLKKVKKIEYVVIISGAKIGGKSLPLVPKLAETAYSSPINIPSLHIFGKNDKEWPNSPELVEAYVDPLVIKHNGGHEVPKLDEEGLKIMIEFLKKINAIA